MLCNQCSAPNPDTNRFCGECGQPLILVKQPVSATSAETVPEEPQPTTHHKTQPMISGPSFLGLTDSDEIDDSNYLLEDERPRRGHLGWFLFSAIAVTVLAVIGWMEWKAIQTGKLPMPSLQTTSASPAPQSTQPPSQNTDAETPAPPPETNSIQKPQAGPTDAHSNSISADGTKDEPAAVVEKSETKKSDAQATQENESRLAQEANARKAQELSDDSEETSSDSTKPAAKPVSAITPKPDPRKNQMLLTGERYLYGRGVRQDCNQALIYFRAAAQDQNGPAMSHLGAMYASGHCVTPNRVAAYKWFARAGDLEPGNQWISRSLNMLWRDMTPQERASVAR